MPVSTFYIPFPITIAMVLCCIPPLVSKIHKRFRKQTLLVPSFTIVVAFFETVTLLVMVFEAYGYGINTTLYLALMGLIFTFAANMFFSLMYC